MDPGTLGMSMEMKYRQENFLVTVEPMNTRREGGGLGPRFDSFWSKTCHDQSTFDVNDRRKKRKFLKKQVLGLKVKAHR